MAVKAPHLIDTLSAPFLYFARREVGRSMRGIQKQGPLLSGLKLLDCRDWKRSGGFPSKGVCVHYRSDLFHCSTCALFLKSGLDIKKLAPEQALAGVR
jgi:hypothetical protein